VTNACLLGLIKKPQEKRGKKQGDGKITRGAGRITAMKERRGKERMSM